MDAASPFSFGSSASAQTASAQHLGEVLFRLLAAAVLGALLAYRPWRRFLPAAPEQPATATHTQLLLCVAGALMIAVVGDSLARAFGLVGLGGFIRFRSGIKDPRDATVMFVMIAIGMACGIGLLPLALLGTVFAGVMLAVLDFTGKSRPEKARLILDVAQPRSVASQVRAAFVNARLLEVDDSSEHGRLVVEVDAADAQDAEQALARLETRDIRGIHRLAIEPD